MFKYIGPGGDNGKSKLCEILKDLLGKYAHKASAKLLCGKDDAASFANFAGKRFIYFEEPEFKKKIQSYLIKELTGGNEFSARNLYSSNTANQLCATFVLNTNSIPQFTQADNAMANRLITVTWNSRFTKNQDEVKPDEHIYLADNNIGSKSWNDKYLPHLFNYSLKYHTKWLDNGQVIYETESQTEDNADILRFSDNFKIWLDTVAVKTNDIHDYITFDQLKRKLLASEYWANLPKSNKSIGAEAFLKKELRDRNETRSWIRNQKTIRGKVHYFWLLAGFVSVDHAKNQENRNQISGRKRLRSKSSSQVEALLGDISNTIGTTTNVESDQSDQSDQSVHSEPQTKKRRIS